MASKVRMNKGKSSRRKAAKHGSRVGGCQRVSRGVFLALPALPADAYLSSSPSLFLF